MRLKFWIASLLIPLLLTGCQQPEQSQTAEEFVQSLSLTDEVVLVDNEQEKVVLGTLDEAQMKEVDALIERKYDAEGTELLDATSSSTFIIQEGESVVSVTQISDLQTYATELEIPTQDLAQQNFLYRIKKI